MNFAMVPMAPVPEFSLTAGKAQNPSDQRELALISPINISIFPRISLGSSISEGAAEAAIFKS